MKSLLATLALIGGVALIGCDNREAPVPYGKPSDTEGKPVERAQVKDPVCGMMIDSDKAKDHTYQDVKYYFCSQACHDAFEKNPETYVARPGK
jgi:YHS domain-containing protein